MASFREPTIPPADTESVGPRLILAFERLPTIRMERFCARIAEPEPLPEPPAVSMGSAVPQGAAFVAFVRFGGHTVQLTGIAGPAGKPVLDRTVVPSPCSPEEKQAISRHAAQIVCDYAGGSSDPVEQYIALYKVAWGFAEAGLAGVLNEEAWTCQPAGALEKLASGAALAHARESIPLDAWTGLITIPLVTGQWLITRGYNRFGVPDLAYLARDPAETEGVLALFAATFRTLRESGEFAAAGQTLEVAAETFVRFDDVPSQLGLPRGSRTLEIARRLGLDDDALAALP